MELDRVERFGDKIVGARVDGFQAVLPIGLRGDDDQRDEPGGRLLLELPAHIEAVAPGREQIDEHHVRRIRDAATVLKEIHTVPDKDIPRDLWDKAECVIVVPGLKKAAFVFGGEYGKGLMSCRHSGEWSAPIFMQIGKGSWGLQIGAQSIDLVLLVMNEGGVEKMLNNKVTLGAEASVAAGPVGRDTRAG